MSKQLFTPLRTVLFIIIFSTTNRISAQEEFSFELYFEDALGFKDTIIIGYDPLATDTIDAYFGEENIIAQPWNKGLDVRIGDKFFRGSETDMHQIEWLRENTWQTKKQILSSYCPTERRSENISIQFTTNNYPLTVKWDKNLFNHSVDDCRDWSFFFCRAIHFNLDVAGGGIPLHPRDSIVIHPFNAIDMLSMYNSVSDSWVEPSFGLAEYIDDSLSIGVFQFVFHDGSAVNVENNLSKKLKIYPNPVTNSQLTIQSENTLFYHHATIFDIQGRQVFNAAINTNNEKNTLTIQDLSEGMYILQLDTDKGLINKKVQIVR